LWLVAYFLEDVLAERRGAEPLFSSTVERVEAPWVRLVFLSLPLQIVLVMVATVLARVPRLGAQRAGFLLASLALALAMGHAAISLATR